MGSREARILDPVGPNTDPWESAWRSHAVTMLRFATVLVGPHDAHDIATRAFVRVMNRTDLDGVEHVDRYLLRAVRNEAHNQFRRRRRRWQRDLSAVGADVSHDPVPDVDLLRAVADLSVHQRSVVFLAYWQDLTESEIAETLGVARSTVHRTLVRARSRLRKALS